MSRLRQRCDDRLDDIEEAILQADRDKDGPHWQRYGHSKVHGQLIPAYHLLAPEFEHQKLSAIHHHITGTIRNVADKCHDRDLSSLLLLASVFGGELDAARMSRCRTN